jgi:hypothetical protein
MPLFVLIALPAISQLSSKMAFGDMILPIGEEQTQLFLTISQKLSNLDKAFYGNEVLCGKHMVSLAVFLVFCLAAVNHGQLFGSQILKSTWSADDKPTATVDYLREQLDSKKLDAERGFNYDNWGGYLSYKLHRPTAIDDRAEFFGAPFYSKYTIIALDAPGWKEQLDGGFYKDTAKSGSTVQWVLMPRGDAINRALTADPDWGPPVKSDRASELFVRKN